MESIELGYNTGMTQVEDERIIEVVREVCPVYSFWKKLPVQGQEIFISNLVNLLARDLSPAETRVMSKDPYVTAVFNDSRDMLTLRARTIDELRAKRRAVLPAGYLLQ